MPNSNCKNKSSSGYEITSHYVYRIMDINFFTTITNSQVLRQRHDRDNTSQLNITAVEQPGQPFSCLLNFIIINDNNSTQEPASLNVGELRNTATNLKKIQDAEIVKYIIHTFVQ